MTEEEFISTCENYGICAIEDDADMRETEQVSVQRILETVFASNLRKHFLQHPLVGSDECSLEEKKAAKLVSDFLRKLAVYTTKVVQPATASSLTDLDSTYPPGKVSSQLCRIFSGAA
jgi:hypothetical protein